MKGVLYGEGTLVKSQKNCKMFPACPADHLIGTGRKGAGSKPEIVFKQSCIDSGAESDPESNRCDRKNHLVIQPKKHRFREQQRESHRKEKRNRSDHGQIREE